MKCSKLGPLAGTDDKIVCWTAPVPNASHKAPGIKTHILSHIHTEHRPHAAPKGQEETLIRGQGSSSESETASMGAEEPEQAGLTSAPAAQALHPDGQTLGLSAGRVSDGHQVAPTARSLPGFWAQLLGLPRQSQIQPLFPTSAVGIFRQDSGG